MTATDKFINEENLRMKRKELSMTGFERLIEEEKKEAIEEKEKEFVKNLLSMDMDIIFIMKATGLTKEEVLKIQQELN